MKYLLFLFLIGCTETGNPVLISIKDVPFENGSTKGVALEALTKLYDRHKDLKDEK